MAGAAAARKPQRAGRLRDDLADRLRAVSRSILRLPLSRLLLALAAVLLLPGAARAAEHADDPIIVISGPASIGPDQVVEGVVVLSGDARIDGTVAGDVFVFDGDVTLSGTVEGDLTTIMGTAVLRPGAEVEGDVVYGDEAPEIAPEASVGGTVDGQGWDGPSGALGLIGAAALWLAMTVSALILGIVLVLLLPRAADALSARAQDGLAVSFAIGVAVLIGLPVIAAGLAVSLVGFPLAIAVVLALLPLAAIAYVVSAWAIGRALVKEPGKRVLAFLAGLAILRALALVPILGAIVWLVAVAIGLGLMVRVIAAAREPAETVPPPATA